LDGNTTISLLISESPTAIQKSTHDTKTLHRFTSTQTVHTLITNMNANINMDSTITGLMNDKINMYSTIAGSVNDNINMDSTIT
jgi:hypothetical protein